jgi:FMN phosphatase YigB (HAD superfamily)
VTGDCLAITTSDPAELLAEVSGVARIVFDLDGTLYDARDFERPALAAVASWLSAESGQPLRGLSHALRLRRETARHKPGLFDDLLAEYRLPISWGAECARRFRDYPGLELQQADSLKECLKLLRAPDRRLALVSNGHAELQQRKLEHLGLARLFDICVFCDPQEPEQLKPSGWAWTRLAAWRSTMSTAYVGDDPVDSQFAAAGGVRFVPFRFKGGQGA